MTIAHDRRMVSAVGILGLALLFAQATQGQTLIFNSNLDNGGLKAPRPDAAHVQRLRASGWKCPEPAQWPAWWQPRGVNVTLATFPDGGKQGAYCRISGSEGNLACPAYPLKQWREWVKEEEKGNYGDDHLFTIWVRGKGVLSVGFDASGEPKEGKPATITAPAAFTVKVDSDAWVRYAHLIRRNPDIATLVPVVGALEGEIDFDELTLWPAEPGRALLVEEEERLYGTGALIETMTSVAADATYWAKAAEFNAAVAALLPQIETADKALFISLRELAEVLKPYASTRGISIVQATHYNDIIALPRVLQRLAGTEPGAPAAIKAMKVPEIKINYRPGVREARPDAVTITDIRSNKVRYSENEAATTIVTLVNKMAAAAGGTIKARMILDLDTVRELAAEPFTLAPGEEKKWSIAYNVGPETYGRAIEVEFVGSDGKTFDKWQEYYAVAAEFFRVYQSSYQGATKYWPADFHIFYFNQSHYFAAEPTDFGIVPFEAEVYKSGQAGYTMSQPGRKGQIANNKTVGIATSFYVTGDFCGQLGYEQARQYPEYVLYSASGQWSDDPVYGGYPNPMELASPLETGPKRKEMKIKPYLDRDYAPWQHTIVNMASEEAVVWGVERMKAYADAWDFDGTYWDGTLGVWEGYNYDGTHNVPSGNYEDYVALSARNHRLWNQILKRDNPNFGTWLNWSSRVSTSDWAKKAGIRIWLGTGVEGDPLDDAFRAATAGRNVMILDETQSLSGFKYQELLEVNLLTDRDHAVQKYGANMVKGYLGNGVAVEEPGPTKWGWPTWNYILAQFIATQTHLASFFIPSYRPSFQFMTRYSRFIWAPDIKALPADEVDKRLAVTAPEEIWWKRLVYQRQTDQGYDLIVHLVRRPPTERVEFTWVDEPLPLEGTTLTVDLGVGTLQTAQACRPCYFEEPQQTVEQLLSPAARTGKISVTVPPFRYHTMLVFRVAEGK